MTSLLPIDHNAPATFDLTIRFSASIPDLLLAIPRSRHANTCTLKVEIRDHLPADLAKRRIRLIYAGKALADEGQLDRVLKVPSRAASPRPSTPLQDASGKGKAVIRDPPAASRIYIHCSIGDVVLSPEELAAERTLAIPASATAPRESAIRDASAAASTTPAPRGFDRLLTAGFTAAEVSSLRLQFLAIQAHTHTPDSMPSPNTMRSLEDQWLDNSNNAETTTGGVADPEDAAGALDDMLLGATCGFFWPIGCLLWAGREEGIWTRRRKMAVVMGVIMNIAVGMLRWMR
jgi:iron-sulfur cluster assembly 1